MAPRERAYSEDMIQKALNNPAIQKVKSHITDMAEQLKHMESDGSPVTTQEDDQTFQRAVSKPRQQPAQRPRGPLAGQNAERRVQAKEETVDRILHTLQQGRGQIPTDDADEGEDIADPRNQGFVDDFDDGEDADPSDFVEPEMPPPRPRPRPGQARQRPENPGPITNRDVARGTQAQTGGYQPPPRLSDVQALRLELEQTRTEMAALRDGKRVPSADAGTGKIRFARKPTRAMGDAQKVPLLSEHLFYKFSPDDFTARVVDIQTQFMISQAKAARDGQGDVPMLIDALQLLVNPEVDLRLLTEPDFFYFLYWMRFNSYPAMPFNIRWRSRYGNENLFAVTEPNLRYLRCEPDLDDLVKWQDMGLDYPRMRDWEILNCMDLEPEDREIYERAQYFQGDTPEEKVDRMYAASPQALFEKDRMMAACNHGVIDTVDLVDLHFDPVKWRDQILSQIPAIREDAESYKVDEPMMALQINARADAYQTEADAITDSLAKGERVEANAERVALRFAPLAFFPLL